MRETGEEERGNGEMRGREVSKRRERSRARERKAGQTLMQLLILPKKKTKNKK